MVRRGQAVRRPRFGRFVSDRSGVSATEFALLLPLMLLLYLGGVELGDALTIDRKVTHVSSSMADLVSQSKTISNADMTNIFDAAAAVIIPYDVTLLRIKVSGVTIDGDGQAKVVWSDARNDTPLAKNSIITLPPAVSQPNTFLVTAEVHYTYMPTIGYVITGAFDLADQFYLRPRLTDTVKRPPQYN